jgi:DICT domain-containing protein
MIMFILHNSSKLQIDSFIHAHSRRNDEEDELMIEQFEPDLMRANRWKKIPHFKLYSRCHLAREAYQTTKINCLTSDKTGYQVEKL